jgi:invasion protein IalB
MNGTASILGALAARCVGVFGSVSLALVLAVGAADTAVAQAKKDTKAAPAASKQPAAAQPQAEQAMWVKLCEKAPVLTKGPDGKDVKGEKGICLTHHERLDGNTGMVLVSAAVRQVEGADKQHLMVMVPLGMAIQPGLRASIYNKELWDKAQKNEKVDDAKLSPINLKFSLCHPAGCTAELELDNDLLEKLKGNAGLMIFAINANGQVIAFPVPLAGFGSAFQGQPVDNKLYTQERQRLMKEIAERQEASFAEMKKKELEAAAAAQRAAETAQPAAGTAKPAEKKK